MQRMQEREGERERKKKRKTAKGEGGQPGQREKEREEARGECMLGQLGCTDRDGVAACAHAGRMKEREPRPAPREENKEEEKKKGGRRKGDAPVCETRT